MGRAAAPPQALEEITPEELAHRMAQGQPVTVVDVREPEEWIEGHIPGARHIPLRELPRRLQELQPDEELVVVCRSGSRSARACEYLTTRGYRAKNLRGGMLGWRGPVARD